MRSESPRERDMEIIASTPFGTPPWLALLVIEDGRPDSRAVGMRITPPWSEKIPERLLICVKDSIVF